MALTNSLKKQVDTPVWEWCRFFPAANSAISEMTCVETPDTRYIYMLVSSTFWRYDTYSDMWQVLAPPATAPLLILSLKYLPYGSFTGHSISGTNNTITGPFLNGNKFTGYKIRIFSGTGAGQERTITACSDPIIADSGIFTTGGTLTSVDTTKKWDINQWVGYTCKIVLGGGVTQRRKILYNTATTLTFSDVNWQELHPQDNVPFITTTATTSIYTIESNVITVDTNWTTNPDGTSRFRILSGLIGCLSTTSAAPFQTFQVYDIAHDTWIPQSTQQGFLLAAGAVANDISFHKLDEGESGVLVSSTATVTGSSTYALGDTTKTWAVDQWANHELKITGGTGAGTRERIVGNTASVLYIASKITQPDATSTYVIRPLRSHHFASGWGLASMLGYDSDVDKWMQGFRVDEGLANVLSIRLSNAVPVACTATRAVNGIQTINPVPIAPGANYVVGDVLTCNQTGSGGLLIVTSTDNAGAVTGLKIQKCGTNYGVSTGQTLTGGSGNGACTFQITAVNTIGTITTAINHHFPQGEVITFAGAVEAAWNTTYTVIGVSSLTTLDVVTTATATAAATTAQANNVIVDASKNWTVNEHAGKIVQLSLLGTTGTTQFSRIATNTATALTLYGSVLGGAATEGKDRYLIHDADAFGRAVQDKNPVRTNTGWATGGSPTTLVDNTKSWKGNQWLGCRVHVRCGTGFNIVQAVVTSNTSNTLTVSGGYGFTPDTTTKYMIEDSFGIVTTITNVTNAVVTDAAKNWYVNQWSGFRIRITAGEGAGQEATITSNTATALTITGTFTTIPVINSTTYTILGVPIRGTGHELTWAANSTVSPARYIYSPRGSISNAWDRYDITTNLWDLTFVAGPDTDTFTVGTMYAYDGKDRIYIQKDNTGRCMYIDLTSNTMHGAGTMPYIIGSSGIGTAVNGNRMEVVQTTDGLKYLYVMKHTGAALSATGGGTEMFRHLIFY